MKTPLSQRKLLLPATFGITAHGAKPRRLRNNGLFYQAKSSKPEAVSTNELTNLASAEDATAAVLLSQFSIEMSAPVSNKQSILLSIPGANEGFDWTQAMGSLDLSTALNSLSVPDVLSIGKSIDYTWNGANDDGLVQSAFDVTGLNSGIASKAGKGSKSGAVSNPGATPSHTDLLPTGDAASQLLPSPEVEPTSPQDFVSNGDHLWAGQEPTESPSYNPTGILTFAPTGSPAEDAAKYSTVGHSTSTSLPDEDVESATPPVPATPSFSFPLELMRIPAIKSMSLPASNSNSLPSSPDSSNADKPVNYSWNGEHENYVSFSMPDVDLSIASLPSMSLPEMSNMNTQPEYSWDEENDDGWMLSMPEAAGSFELSIVGDVSSLPSLSIAEVPAEMPADKPVDYSWNGEYENYVSFSMRDVDLSIASLPSMLLPEMSNMNTQPEYSWGEENDDGWMLSMPEAAGSFELSIVGDVSSLPSLSIAEVPGEMPMDYSWNGGHEEGQEWSISMPDVDLSIASVPSMSLSEVSSMEIPDHPWNGENDDGWLLSMPEAAGSFELSIAGDISSLSSLSIAEVPGEMPMDYSWNGGHEDEDKWSLSMPDVDLSIASIPSMSLPEMSSVNAQPEYSWNEENDDGWMLSMPESAGSFELSVLGGISSLSSLSIAEVPGEMPMDYSWNGEFDDDDDLSWSLSMSQAVGSPDLSMAGDFSSLPSQSIPEDHSWDGNHQDDWPLSMPETVGSLDLPMVGDASSLPPTSLPDMSATGLPIDYSWDGDYQNVLSLSMPEISVEPTTEPTSDQPTESPNSSISSPNVIEVATQSPTPNPTMESFLDHTKPPSISHGDHGGSGHVFSLSMPEMINLPTIDQDGDHLWDVFEKSEPTAAPTSKRTTESPTSSISAPDVIEGATQSPTTNPTKQPALDPTYSPSSAPTYKPTIEATTGTHYSTLTVESPVDYELPTADPTVPKSENSDNPDETAQSSMPTSHLTAPPSTNPTHSPTTAPPPPNPTHSPTSRPVETVPAPPMVEAASIVQFKMETMNVTMNMWEVLGIFQPSCKEFLTVQLGYEDTPVSDIECQVTNQQLLSRRVLTDSGLRRLQDFSSLLIDVSVTGSAESELHFDEMIYDVFDAKSDLFIDTLKVKGAAAGISVFDELHSMTSVEQANEKIAITEESGSGTVDEERMSGPLIALVTVACVVVALVGIVAYTRMSTDEADESIARAAEEEFGAVDPEVPTQIGKVSSNTSGTGFNFGLGAFLEHMHCGEYIGQLSESEQKLSQKGTMVSQNGTMVSKSLTPGGGLILVGTGSILDDAQASSASEESEVSQVVPRVHREIIAPPGKLGIIMECSESGPIVHSVREESPLKGLIHKGDLIGALDGMDTSHLSSQSLTKLMASRSRHVRRITVLSLKSR